MGLLQDIIESSDPEYARQNFIPKAAAKSNEAAGVSLSQEQLKEIAVIDSKIATLMASMKGLDDEGHRATQTEIGVLQSAKERIKSGVVSEV